MPLRYILDCIKVDDDGTVSRICPICYTKLYYQGIDLARRIPYDMWCDERLAISCCKCINLINYIEMIEKNFNTLFRATAVIGVNYHYDRT